MFRYWRKILYNRRWRGDSDEDKRELCTTWEGWNIKRLWLWSDSSEVERMLIKFCQKQKQFQITETAWMALKIYESNYEIQIKTFCHDCICSSCKYILLNVQIACTSMNIVEKIQLNHQRLEHFHNRQTNPLFPLPPHFNDLQHISKFKNPKAKGWHC